MIQMRIFHKKIFNLQSYTRIPPTGMSISKYTDLVLSAGMYKSEGEYLQSFKDGTAKCYHIPESTIKSYKIPRAMMREMKFCALSVKQDRGRVCEYIYPIKSIQLKKRNEIDEYAGGPSSRAPEALYWLIELDKSLKLNNKLIQEKKSRSFNFKLVPFKEFINAESWDALESKYSNKLIKSSS